MLDIRNFAVTDATAAKGLKKKVAELSRITDARAVDYFRLSTIKNNLNRQADYQYLSIPIDNSTEPIRGMDYIHPIVCPSVDFATATVTKCLMPNGKVNFEFNRFNEKDSTGALQSTEMVKHVINRDNNSYQVVRNWVQDAMLHKNGLVMVQPIETEMVQYKEITGTKEELQAFEALAYEKGWVAKRTEMRPISINPEKAIQGVSEWVDASSQNVQAQLQAGETPDPNEMVEAFESTVDQATEYAAKYKLVGTNLDIRMIPIAQHYWICNPMIQTVQSQDFCGFFEPMSLHQVGDRYPDVDLEEFAKHAKSGPAGAYIANAIEASLAIHVRDSQPVQGQGFSGSAATDENARTVTIGNFWIRYDIDDDGKEELVELTVSGTYIISAKEVEFIPIAGMCPKPLPGNFYGYSVAERLIPMQEYATAVHRAEIAFALQASTARIGANPEMVDLEEIQSGKSSVFVLDRKFDPAKHIWQQQPMQGNLGYVQSTMERFNQDRMAMIGMTSPQDVMNPEVMKDGNSGFKLQLAMGPNQLIQDEMVKNCAIGLTDVIYLVWRTLVQYSDTAYVQRLAQACDPESQGVFHDAVALENYEFIDRKDINVDLAIGFLSDENRLTKHKLIIAGQQEFAQTLMTLGASLTEALFQKIRLPYADTLYTLGVKNIDEYLITFEEAMTSAQAKAQAGPGPEEQEILSKVELNKAKAQESQIKAQAELADLQGTSASKQLEILAAQSGKLHGVEVQ